MISKIARASAVSGVLFAISTLSAQAEAKRHFGEGSVFASIPAEAHYCTGEDDCNGGFPEGVLIDGDRVYVSGPAALGTAGKSESVITVLDRSSGALVDEIVVQGENLQAPHAIVGLSLDEEGRVYVLSLQLGVLRFTKHRHGHHVSYTQETYATLPAAPGCPAGALCSLPNEMTFDDAGFLYVTDSLQGAIYRASPGGGEAELWFQDARLTGSPLAGVPVGANGIRVSPDREWIYVAESFDPFDPAQDTSPRGVVYRIPLVDAPAAAEMEVVHVFPGDGPIGPVPDSLVFGRSGTLYVSLGGANQIAVLNPDGDEVTRISGPFANPGHPGDPMPFDAPADMAFDNHTKSLLVTNHAFLSGNPDHFAVLSVYVGEKGDPLSEPCVP